MSSIQAANCSICFETMKNAVITDCFHTFCEPCITTWLTTKQICPLCNFVIRQKPSPNHTVRQILEELAQKAESAARPIRSFDIVLPLDQVNTHGARIDTRDSCVQLQVGEFKWQLRLQSGEHKVSFVLHHNRCIRSIDMKTGSVLQIGKEAFRLLDPIDSNGPTQRVTQADFYVDEVMESGKKYFVQAFSRTMDVAALVLRGNFTADLSTWTMNETTKEHCHLVTLQSEDVHPLMHAAREIESSCVHTLIKQGCDAKMKDAHSNSLLHDLKPYKGWRNCIDMCLSLIEQGVDLDGVNDDGLTALSALARKKGSFYQEVILGLIKKGASLRGVDVETLQRVFEAALRRSTDRDVCNASVLQRLLCEGSVRMDSNCWHLINARIETALLETLVAHGNRGQPIDFRQETVTNDDLFFHDAVVKGRLPAIQLLVSHHFPFARQQCEHGCGNCLEIAIEYRHDDTALYFAQLGMQVKKASSLLQLDHCPKTKEFIEAKRNAL